MYAKKKEKEKIDDEYNYPDGEKYRPQKQEIASMLYKV